MTQEKSRHVAQVVKGLGKRLMQFIRARVRNDADAEDVLQDVWQQLIITLDAGPVEQVGAWLYRVARNRIIDRYRKSPMLSLDAMSADEEGEEFNFAEFLLRDDKTPRTEHFRNRFWEVLSAALAALPEDQRHVFVWHELEDLSFDQIALMTGEKVNTLLSRKRYAVLRLRVMLEPLRDEFFAAQP